MYVCVCFFLGYPGSQVNLKGINFYLAHEYLIGTLTQLISPYRTKPGVEDLCKLKVFSSYTVAFYNSFLVRNQFINYTG